MPDHLTNSLPNDNRFFWAKNTIQILIDSPTEKILKRMTAVPLIFVKKTVVIILTRSLGPKYLFILYHFVITNYRDELGEFVVSRC